jgi:hypothetical protein
MSTFPPKSPGDLHKTEKSEQSLNISGSMDNVDDEKTLLKGLIENQIG